MERQARRCGTTADRSRTRDRILRAATKVFAEHGFREATTRMICAEAAVNSALVNYHFRSKAELYRAVIVSLFEHTGKPMMRITETVTDEASWKAAVRAWIERSLAICAASEPPEVWAARLMGMEECVPSELAQDIETKFAKPVRQCFQRLLRMGMKRDDPVEVGLWASAIHAQCVVFALTRPGWVERFCPPGVSREVWLRRVADHLCEGVFARLSYQGARK
ncbi:MAG: helix-turn-helix domain-containing protein [Kiritimatiellia bacterium]|jgi:AcrR family transcriptional regulator|nr:helix-turn-helix domain-containing protein [Kiritimatiellia bacterium]